MSRKLQAFFYGNPDQYPPIINSARFLAQAGFEIDIFCRCDDRQWDVSYPPSVRIYRLRPKSKDGWFEYLSFVTQALRLADPDTGVFIGHDMHGLLPARLASKRYGRPVIYHCHDFAEDGRQLSFGMRMVRAFERRFARTARLVLVPDADRARTVSRQLNLKADPVIVANAPLSGRITSSKDRLRETLKNSGHDFDAILFRQGRIGVGHAIESTLRSIPFWSNPRWGFVVMGLSDADYLEKLRGIAKSIGVEDQFQVLPPVGYDEVLSFTAGAQVGHALYDPIHINNEYIATASNKIMEYMECGIPLMVSDTAPLRALVAEYGCGVTADETSPESIASAVNYLLGEPAKARRLGSAARMAFENEFCYERQFAPIISAIQDISSNRSALLPTINS